MSTNPITFFASLEALTLSHLPALVVDIDYYSPETVKILQKVFLDAKKRGFTPEDAERYLSIHRDWIMLFWPRG